MTEPSVVEDILLAALELPTPQERAAFLDTACKGDAELRRRVERLLEAHPHAGHFLENPSIPAADGTAAYVSPLASVGAIVADHYKLLEKIGEGGMGEVWVADQLRPIRRRVALKLIKPGMDTREVIARFEAERQALALMDHPNIARVFDAGATEAGRPFFVMELVRGVPIVEYCDQIKVTARDRLELFVSVCQAVQHAHSKGVIHRDIKPSNILIAPHDGRPVVKVIDFGIAKAVGQQLTDKTIYTRFLQMIGTPLYMSPEQAEINALDVDIRSDVYSLGVLLYELLTGTTPFDGQRFASAAQEEIRRIIKEEEPPKPSTRLSTLGATLSVVSTQRKTDPAKLSALLKGDLDWIVMKALEKDRERRYDTASAFAADVRRFLSEEPIEARSPSPWYRFRKLARRNRGALTTLAIVASALLVGTAVSTWQAVRATHAEVVGRKETDKANKARTLAVQAKEDAIQARKAEAALAERYARLAADERSARERSDRQARIAAAERLMALSLTKRTESPELSLLLAVESGRATQAFGEPLLASSHQALLDALGAIGGRPLVGHRDTINAAVISPDGHWLVTAGDDNTARVWDLSAADPSANPRLLSGHQGAISSVAVSPDSRWLVTGSQDLTARIWDLAAEYPSAGQRRLTGHQQGISGVLISPNGRWVVTTSWDGATRVWELTAPDPGANPRVLTGCERVNHSAAISPDSRWLVTGGKGNTARLWDLSAENAAAGPRVLAGHQESIEAVAIGRDSRWLVTGSADETARIWDLKAEDPSATVRVLPGQGMAISHVAISPDGRWLFTVPMFGSVTIWDLKSGEIDAAKPRGIGGGNLAGVGSLALSPEGRWLVITPGNLLDNAGRVWDLSTEMPGDVRKTLNGHQDWITCAAIRPGGSWLVTGSRDKTARIWDLAAENPSDNARVLRGHQGAIQRVLFTPDGRRIVTLSDDHTCRVWDFTPPTSDVPVPVQGANPGVVSGEHGWIDALSFSPDSRRVVGVGQEGSARVWDLTAENPCAESTELVGHKSTITSVAISRDAHWLVTGSQDKTARVWNLKAQNPAATSRVLSGHQDAVRSVAISGDGQRAVTASDDKTVRVWDLSAENPATSSLVLTGTQSPIQSVAISHDGRRMVSRSGDNSARIWDLSAANPAANPQTVNGITLLSDDGRWAISQDGDESARVWDLASANPATQARVIAGLKSPINPWAISPDGRWLVTKTHKGAHLWDLSADDPASGMRALSVDLSKQYQIAISADCRWLVIGTTADRTTRVWDLSADNPAAGPRVLGGLGKVFVETAISPDGRWIATTSEFGVMQLWRFRWDDLETLANRVGRNFTRAEWLVYFPGNPYRKTFPKLPVADDTDYVERGKQHFDANEYEKSLMAFAEAIRLDPTAAAAFDARATLFATAPEPKARNGALAVADATRACELANWTSVPYIITLAAAHAESGQFEQAVRWQTKAIDLTPKPERESLRARLRRYRLKQPYHRSPNPDDRDDPAWLRHVAAARENFKSSKFPECVAECQAALRIDDGAAEPRELLLNAALSTQNWAMAEEPIRFLMNDDPRAVERVNEAAHALAEKHEWKAAVDAYTVGVSLSPDNAFLAYLRAVAQRAGGDVDGYRSSCRAMLQHAGPQPAPKAAERILYTSLFGKGLEAAELVRLAQISGVPRQLAAALCRNGEYQKSLATFVPGGEGFYGRAWDWYFVAIAQHGTGNDAEARRSAENARDWIAKMDAQPGPGRGWFEEIEEQVLRSELEALLPKPDGNAK